MQRFFVTFPLDIDLTITDKDIYHQLTRVMRVRTWEYIILFNGDGSETKYEIMLIDKKSISLHGIDRNFPWTESTQNIILHQAMPNKYEKIEYILQKWVEIGISKFVFFRSNRSQNLLINPKKLERFSTIAREALEQCGWVLMPEIEFVDDIWGYRCECNHHIVLDTIWKIDKIHQIPVKKETIIWVGPEGWWSDEERQIMNDKGFIFVHLWERVMRTETAGMVMAFSLMHA